MTEGSAVTPNDPRSQTFGEIAGHYERFRPGPPEALVEWMLPGHVGTVVDLGAGTGALTRMLIAKADEVVAVEPDARMREELTRLVPQARSLEGKGESIPLPDHVAAAVLASSSWHWMDPVPTLHEVARVLQPGGRLGAIWSGPDPDGALLVQARELLSQGNAPSSGEAIRADEFTSLIQGDGNRPESSFEIPPGVPFSQPEHQVLTWDVALNADELIGLLGTFSWIILLSAAERDRLFSEARRILSELLGVEGDVTIDVGFRAEAWRCQRDS
jgi:SAM-dependent methyltransferase